MKRSKRITLVLMGAAGILSLTACDEKPKDEPRFFKSEAECTQGEDPADCKDAFETARKEHWRTAPSYTSRESCEAQFGAANCVETGVQPGTAQAATGGGGLGISSWFIPAMVGYMIGRSTSGLAAMPVYHDVRNQAFLGGRPCGTFTGPSPDPACGRSSAWTGSGASSSTTFRTASSSSYGRWGSSSSSSSSFSSSSTSRGGFGGSAAAHSGSAGS